MNELSDAELIAAVRRGERDLYATLVRRYQGKVWKVAAAMLGDVHLTEDLVQQTFIRAFLKLDAFDARREFGPWLKEMARNEVRQELRRQSREGQRLDFYQEHLLNEGLDEAAEQRRSALVEILRRCRRKLAPQVAEALDWRYALGWSFEQIAVRLGRTLEATRQMLSRARLALRDCVQRKGGTP